MGATDLSLHGTLLSGHTHRVQAPQAILGLNIHLETHRFYARDERSMIQFVPAPSCFEAFFAYDPECLVQSVVHRDRSGVMISAIAPPIFFDHRDVEIPALNLGSTRANAFKRSLGKSDRRKTGRGAQTLLRARIANVDFVAIDSYRMSAERSHRIDNQQSSIVVRDVSEAG